MKHKHVFEILASRATGYLETQEGQHNIIACEGNVHKCRCGTAILVPYNENLNVVEVDA